MRSTEGNTDELQIFNSFKPLSAALLEGGSFPKTRPLLAHYTSIQALEAMLRSNEIWFSNPLFMNDIEEVCFGIGVGANLFLTSPELESACGNKERFNLLKSKFIQYYNAFANEHGIDTYVFCLSEHKKDDGLLSMWRAYGGNGSGVASVFDTEKLSVRDDSPLTIARVQYASTEKRTNRLQQLTTQFAEIVRKTNVPDNKLYLGAYYFYMRERDRSKALERMISYWVGPRGVEPKLKLRIEHFPGLTDDDLSLSKIIERIILGPSLSSPLARASILKVFDTLGRSDLKDWIKSSTIRCVQGEEGVA